MGSKIPKWVFKLPWNIIHNYAVKYGLPPELIGAVIHIESASNTYAMRYEPKYRWTHGLMEFSNSAGATYSTMEQMQKTSYGYMQVMGGVYYEHITRDDSFWATSMIDPYIGIDFGCRHLKKKFITYGPDAAHVYAAYNAGSVRKTAGGHFKNQSNVDVFMRYYRELTQF